MRLALIALFAAAPAFAHDGFCKNWKWITVDDFSSPSTKNAASSIVVTRNATYVAGFADDAVNGHWIVRKTTDDGVTWTTVDDYVHQVGYSNHPEGIAIGTGGNVFVVGGSNDTSWNGSWLVRRSVNGGATWSLLDLFHDPAAPAGSARAIAIDTSGTVLVTGENNVGSEGYHWYLRRSADQGLTWTNDDDRAPSWSSASGRGIALNSNGTQLVSGFDYDNGSHYRCQVRRKLPGATAWTMVDDYQLADPKPCMPRAALAAKGHIFRALEAQGADGLYHWLVRKSSDNGTTWTNVDDLVMEGCMARGIGWDKKTQLYVVGKCHTAGGYKWVTRRSTDLGATWTTEEIFALANPSTTYASAVDADDHGGVYAVGVGSDGTRNHWLVRKRVCLHGHDADDLTETQVLRSFKKGTLPRSP